MQELVLVQPGQSIGGTPTRELERSVEELPEKLRLVLLLSALQGYTL